MGSLPLLLPARRKAAMDRMMPKTSWERMVRTLPWAGSGLRRERRVPQAVMICCSLVPENWPTTAWVTVDGGWIVSEYMNMLDVVAILTAGAGKACAAPS